MATGPPFPAVVAMYRVRTALMIGLAALGFTVLQSDRELSRQLQQQQLDIDAISADLKQQLEGIRARRQRLNEATENISAAYSAAECSRKLPALRHTSIVYTWVNGSDPAYMELRKEHGGPVSACVVGPRQCASLPTDTRAVALTCLAVPQGVVGGARDRSIDELRYSIRSLIKYIPWLEGRIYIVSPAQTPVPAQIYKKRATHLGRIACVDTERYAVVALV